MTNSTRTRCTRLSMWLFAASVMAVVSGCQLITAGMYVFAPNDIPAEFPGLEGQRVVVICNEVGVLGYQDAAVRTDLARVVSNRLQKNVKKIDVVSQDEINDWVDTNDVRYAELGKAMDADSVVSIELEHFNLYKGPSLYQGQAEMSLVVYDVETEETHDLKPMESLYPPHSGIPLDESEGHFRRRFVNVLGTQIARKFHPHESIEASKDRLYPSE